jgi:hypothetical protein
VNTNIKRIKGKKTGFLQRNLRTLTGNKGLIYCRLDYKLRDYLKLLAFAALNLRLR